MENEDGRTPHLKKIMVSFGTRPEAIKMCPLVKELQQLEDVSLYVCVSGQHREMLQSVLDIFGVSPDLNLNVMTDNQGLKELTEKVVNGMSDVLEKEKPDLLLVHGDTTTSYASALAAFYKRIPVGHVEAGLRTYNMSSPFPEEFNRVSIDLMSDLCFAPTEVSKNNLIKEGKSPDKVFVTGNTIIDALNVTLSSDVSFDFEPLIQGRKIILLTAHRRENFGKPMKEMFRAISDIAAENRNYCFVYTVHKNPLVYNTAHECFEGAENVILTEPLDVVHFHKLLSRSEFVLTDSGGLQEEGPALGKPVLIMRNTTERPEVIDAGCAKMVGNSYESVYNGVKELINNRKQYKEMSVKSFPFGKGGASLKISKICQEYLAGKR